jgi:hypothetical protein
MTEYLHGAQLVMLALLEQRSDVPLPYLCFLVDFLKTYEDFNMGLPHTYLAGGTATFWLSR